MKRWVSELKAARNGLGILLGDSLDSARTHYRDHIRAYRADSNSQLALDDHVRRDVADLARVLEPVKKQLLGAILGNHFWEFSDGTNSEQYLCQILGIPYLGPLGVIRLEFLDRGTVRDRLTLFAHHHGGTQGGRTTGGDVAALERSEMSFDADVYVMGHTHRRFGFKLPQLGVSARGLPRIVERTKVFIRAGAFLKGFGEDSPSTTRPHVPSYAESKALRPTDLGYVRLDVTMRRWGHGGQDVRKEFRVSY